MKPLKAVFGSCGGASGAVLEQIPVLVLELSKGGCVLESHVRLDEGSAGELRMSIGGTRYSDDIRVCRCNVIEGAGSTYRVAAELLRTHPPTTRSIRRILNDL